jgi:hypothetical protein
LDSKCTSLPTTKKYFDFQQNRNFCDENRSNRRKSVKIAENKDHNIDPRFIDEGVPFDVSHPFHMHGTSFYVVAMERHAVNSSNTGPVGFQGMYIGKRFCTNRPRILGECHLGDCLIWAILYKNCKSSPTFFPKRGGCVEFYRL